jgi:hypothetical protein
MVREMPRGWKGTGRGTIAHGPPKRWVMPIKRTKRSIGIHDRPTSCAASSDAALPAAPDRQVADRAPPDPLV